MDMNPFQACSPSPPGFSDSDEYVPKRHQCRLPPMREPAACLGHARAGHVHWFQAQTQTASPHPR